MSALSFRRQAARTMVELMQNRLRLAQTPASISAPPSAEPPAHPAVALHLDRHELMFSNSSEIEADGSGVLMLGSRAALGGGVSLVTVDGGGYVSYVGKMTCFGKIWVGARYPAAREEVEEKIVDLFMDDELVPGQWEFEIVQPTIDGKALPFSWHAQAFIDGKIEWSDEKVWTEALWSSIDFTLELPILVSRDPVRFPIVREFQVRLDVDLTQPIVDGKVADLDGGTDDEVLKLNADGDLVIVVS